MRLLITRFGALCAILSVSLLAGCGAPPPSASNPGAPSTNEFSVMSYNLHQYTLMDRDGDGQKNDPKPIEEREAATALIVARSPDILAVQEIGFPGIFEEFRFSLAQQGLHYPHVEYLQRGESELSLAVLSRFPIVNRQPHTDDTYSIGPATISVLRGFIDVEIEPRPYYRLRLMVAHLKSKVFHSLGQTEMRRNEARLLNNHVRRALKDDPDVKLLVVGDMNDDPKSAALREITGAKQQYLQDIRPLDPEGNAWTYIDPVNDQYNRIDYLLASEGLIRDVVREKTRIVRDPLTGKASDHRPLMAVFTINPAGSGSPHATATRPAE